MNVGIAIHVSSELSGTASASKQAAEIAGFPLELVDSKLISLPMSYMITKGQEMIHQGGFPCRCSEQAKHDVQVQSAICDDWFLRTIT